MTDPTTPPVQDAAAPAPAPLVLVAQEGRPDGMVGLRLLVASLARFSPDLPIQAFVPTAMVDEVQRSISAIHPFASTTAFDTEIGWGCKPTVLLQALAAADDPRTRVVWIDADILACDQVERLAALPHETLVVAEETNHHANPRVEERQQALGLTPGPTRVTTLSSCVVGVTNAHRELLKAWEAGVLTDLFASMQGLPWGERLLPGDQEVLEAVACCGEFRQTPLHVLRNHNQMVQATYTPQTPLDGQRPGQHPPLFIHATGNLKPWRTQDSRLTKEMFPYFDHAQPYLDHLEPGERAAFTSSSFPARLCKGLLGTQRGFRAYVAARRLHRRLRG